MAHFVIDPTPAEIAANAKDYQTKTRKIEQLTKELKKLKKSLRCSYCGGPHYSGGYCTACYGRIATGKPLKRTAIRSPEQGKIFARTHCYRKVYGTSPTPDADLTEFAQMIVDAAPNTEMQTLAEMWLFDGMTLEKIGFAVKRSKQWVTQRIDSLCRTVKRNMKEN